MTADMNKNVIEKVRRFAERLALLDLADPNFSQKYADLQQLAVDVVEDRKVPRGNRNIVRARERSAELRQQRAAEMRAAVKPTLDRLKAEGAVTLRQLADGLNASGIRPARAERWSPSLVRHLERS